LSVSSLPAGLFTGLYSLARKSGIIETRGGRWLFTRAYFLYKRHIEDPFGMLVHRHPELFSGGNVLDIGANIGYTASVFVGAAESHYKVYAFEPEDFNFRMLQRVADSIDPAGKIVPVKAAVGDRDEDVELWRNQVHHADHRIVTPQFRRSIPAGALQRVRMMKIDSYVAAQGAHFPIAFIKVDVQGFELPVCLGMEESLDANPAAVVALEYTPGAMKALGFDPADLLDWLAKRKYHTYRLARNGSFRQIQPQHFEVRTYADLLVSRRELAPQRLSWGHGSGVQKGAAGAH